MGAEIKMGAYIHGCLFCVGAYSDFKVLNGSRCKLFSSQICLMCTGVNDINNLHKNRSKRNKL